MRLNMTRLNLKRRHGRGDPCECGRCTGKLTVQCSVPDRDLGIRTRYLYCNVCKWAPEDNKLIGALESPTISPR